MPSVMTHAETSVMQSSAKIMSVMCAPGPCRALIT